MVFIQGGLVGTARYRWQAESLVREGFTVALPEHPLDLAFFAIENGLAAVDLLRSGQRGTLLEGLVDEARIAVAGHSLGGVVAVKVALAGRVAAVVLEASYPDSVDRAAVAKWSRPTLSLAGRSDCSASLEQTAAGASHLASPSAFVVLDGLTHYQFTDSEREDRARGCLPGLSLEEAHAKVTQALVTFLSAALEGRGVDADGLAAIPGAEVSTR
jgi:pimeloyl-ACP methyl ester carboxylesterase